MSEEREVLSTCIVLTSSAQEDLVGLWIDSSKPWGIVLDKVTLVVMALEIERVVLSTSILVESAFCFSFDVKLLEVVVTESAALVLSFLLSFYCKKDSLLLLVRLLEKLNNIFQNRVSDRYFNKFDTCLLLFFKKIASRLYNMNFNTLQPKK